MNLSRLQSEELSAGSVSIKTQENLKFVDAGLHTIKTAPPLGNFRPDSDDGAHLGSFLSRPVQIATHTWLESNASVIQSTFHPWQLYFNDPGIKKKLDNYKLLRCKLHLKFVVNASPFYYGALRVCYNPLNDQRDTYYTTGDQMKLSQVPGVFLEPAEMSTSEMELPFLWPNAWLDATSNLEFTNVGRVQYVLYSKLRSANAVAGASVRIACYAWATDVETAGLTSRAALQSDEYEQMGPISGPASAVAALAGSLSKAPVIGNLATATEIGASAVSSVARLFGFSNPPVIDDAKAYAPKAFHAFSSVDTSMPMDKLTLDPKNEVTMDSSVAGASGEDELVLSDLVRKESFIQGTLWAGTAAENTILWSAPVTPIMAAQNSVGSIVYRNFTPAAYFGNMFAQWRGGMTYRFKFVKSRYHTGRILITWDPDGIQSADYETTTLVRVVDLQTEDEAVVTIPYKQPASWLRTNYATNNFSNSSSPSLGLDGNAQNGVIQVRVLTTLTGPAANPEMDILVFASAASDMEFSVPNELGSDLSTAAIQSHETPVQDSMISDAVSPSGSTPVHLVTVGEDIRSIRAMLHRSTYIDTQYAGNPATGTSTWVNDGNQNCVNYYPRVPDGYGFNPDGPSWAIRLIGAGNTPFCFTPNNPINWVLNCFAGYRGAIVHHFNILNTGLTPICTFAAERDARSPVINPTVNARTRNTTTLATDKPSNMTRALIGQAAGVNRKITGQRGMALTNTQTQSALSVVSPQYSRWRFRPAFEPFRDVFPTGGYNEQESIRVDSSFRATGVGATSSWPVIEHYAAAGVDFNPIYFVCVPTLYVYNHPSAQDAFTP